MRFYPAKLGDQVLAQFKVFNDVAIKWLSRPQVQDDGLRRHRELEFSHRFDDLRQVEARLTWNRSIARIRSGKDPSERLVVRIFNALDLYLLFSHNSSNCQMATASTP